MFGDEAVDEGVEQFAGAGMDEIFHARIPVELEVRRRRGDPDLADGFVGRNDEFVFGPIEEHGEPAIVFFNFEGGVVFLLAFEEMALERGESRLGRVPEVPFVVHRHMWLHPSVARRFGASVTTTARDEGVPS
jgi:hypothetical protein